MTDEAYNILREQVVQCLNVVAEVLCDHAAPGGGGLTCQESNELVELCRAVGLGEIADSIHESHVLTDCDEEDEHHDEYLASDETERVRVRR